MIRPVIALMLCSLIFSRAAAAQTAPLGLTLKTESMPSATEEPDPAPPDEPVQVDPSAPFVPSARPSDPAAPRAVAGALMTVGVLGGMVGLSCLLSSAGITVTEDNGAPVPAPADPKTLQTIGLISLAVGAVGLIAGATVYANTR
jgi:hypothetical protein